MSFGEFLSKIAIVVSGWSWYSTGLLSPVAAIVIFAVLLIASFWHDDWFVTQRVGRLYWTFGTLWLLCVSLSHLFNWIATEVSSTIFMTSMQATAAGFLPALVIQTIMVISEQLGTVVYNVGAKVINDFRGQNPTHYHCSVCNAVIPNGYVCNCTQQAVVYPSNLTDVQPRAGR